MSLLGTFIDKYEGVNIYESARMGIGHDSAGIALPGYGIVVGKGVYSERLDMETFHHEYGHILQARQTGWLKFYLFVGIPSLISAWTNWHGKGHSHYWTELWCNHLSCQHFTADKWNSRRFPPKDISKHSKFWLTNFKI